MNYSIAIRTLGTGGDAFREELESICLQSVQPDRVIIYIAEGYQRPSFTIGREEYIWVNKGMLAQRMLPYKEINSDCILMLDDDVRLAPDSAERMLRALEESRADCVGADAFQNHKMSFRGKFYAFMTNLVLPHRSRKWAFKIHRNGSFSYNNHPVRSLYWSQSCSGPASMWLKKSFLEINPAIEIWLDKLGFAMGEDQLLFFKLYRNKGRLGILYDSGIVHLDAGTASGTFLKNPDRFKILTEASFMIWWRTIYRDGVDTFFSRLLSAFAYGTKILWQIFVMAAIALRHRNTKLFVSFFRGLSEGWKAVHSDTFQKLPPYVFIKDRSVYVADHS